MNKRIKELAKQAHKYADALVLYEPENSEVFEQKFALLIIKECVTTLEFHGYDEAVPYVKWMATNKLGVKE